MVIRLATMVVMVMACHALIAQDMPLTQVLIEGEDWQLVSEGHQFTDGFTSDDKGNFYFSDVLGGSSLYRVAPDGTSSVAVADAPRISGLHFGPDGRIYACQGGDFGRIIAFDLDSDEREVIATGVRPNDLVVTDDGNLYFTETPKKQITRIAYDGTVSAADVADKDDGPTRPNGIALSPDQGTLAVSDHGGRHVWVWRLNPDGSLSHRQPYMTLRTPTPDAASRGDGMTTDAVGRYYVTSAVGIQMYDPTGRMGGVIASPSESPIVSVAFAGKDHSFLYVAAGDKVYRRKTKTQGIR